MKIDKSQLKILEIIWEDKKRTLFGLPISFTTYKLNKETLIIKTGWLNTNEDDIKLYRILDLSVKTSFIQRILGVGTIKINSSDKSLGEFEIKNVKEVDTVKQLISQNVEEQRELKRISGREFMVDIDDDDMN